MKKLICFPCAGGNAKSFAKLIRGIHCFAICAEYSGHWSRYEEPLYYSMEDCIQYQMQELREKITLQDEIFLLGHSMGALIAFELGKNLLNAGYKVKGLYLLACMPPDEILHRGAALLTDRAIDRFLTILAGREDQFGAARRDTREGGRGTDRRDKAECSPR